MYVCAGLNYQENIGLLVLASQKNILPRQDSNLESSGS